ncbi:hypothetical protein [Xanthocytophaga agilis]|uniref:PorV/PorQ family protein n=1 Tax=Xanthocytophaga agilis TaxID=3048010 RepID=A0AAE3R5F1_9BACT|nr:hypothetical protein [Xanthocytophaga agilis]MDJ1504119.1 hypothetical protein [Xanthocytophaga agilis]
MKRLLFFSSLLVIVSIQTVFASGEPNPAGARVWGLANCSVTFSDPWSVWNNPGGLAYTEYSHLLANYNIRYGMSGFQTMAVGYVHPLSKGVLGATLSRLGDELYNETTAGISYGYLWKNISMGLRVNYLQTGMQEVGKKQTVLFEIGTVVQLLPQLSAGVHIYNVSQSKLDVSTNERIPTVMKVGLAYKPHTKLVWTVELEKDINFPGTFRTGLEYEIVKNLRLRTGIATRPQLYSFGIGFSPKKLQLDYAFQTHSTLGLSHNLSLSVRLPKKKTTNESTKS